MSPVWPRSPDPAGPGTPAAGPPDGPPAPAGAAAPADTNVGPDTTGAPDGWGSPTDGPGVAPAGAGPAATADTGPAVDASRGADLALLEVMAADLADIDAAMRRLDDGTYGACEVCAAGIPDAVLAETPLVRRCPAHT